MDLISQTDEEFDQSGCCCVKVVVSTQVLYLTFGHLGTVVKKYEDLKSTSLALLSPKAAFC